MSINPGNTQPTIILKRYKRTVHAAPHANTTWKIALADFMTAMFIIFMLLWLIKTSSPVTRSGIADYFSPQSVSRNTNGSGGVLGGRVITAQGAMTAQSAPLSPITGGGPAVPQDGEGNTPFRGFPGDAAVQKGINASTGENKRMATLEAEIRDAKIEAAKFTTQGGGATVSTSAEKQNFTQIAHEIRQAIQDSPDLQGLQQNLLIEQTPEGLRIELVDNEKRDMFAKGSAKPFAYTVKLLQQVGKIIKDVPNQIALSGHTDALKYSAGSTYTNWELSSDRANASRRALLGSGVGDTRFATVIGKADHEMLYPNEPKNPSNRRISIVLLNDASAAKADNEATAGTKPGVAEPAAPTVTAGAAPTNPVQSASVQPAVALSSTASPSPAQQATLQQASVQQVANGPAPEGRLIPR